MTDPNQKLVIRFLGCSLLVGVGALGVTAYNGAPIDVAVVGVVSNIIGSFATYLTRTHAPNPPGTTEITSTHPAVPPKVTVETPKVDGPKTRE